MNKKQGTPKALCERAALKAAMQALQAAKLSPFDLYAYAVAADAFEHAAEVRSEAGNPSSANYDKFLAGFSVDDALTEMCEAEMEDGRDAARDLFDRAAQMKDRHYRGNGEPL